jgi:DNA adenine methylase
VTPRPFLKWAGGKRQLLPDLLARLPSQLGRYHEPFVGGGALFFALSGRGALTPSGARLSDINPELINAYQMVRDQVETLIYLLDSFRNEEEFFYRVRAQDPRGLEPVQRAARLIYLNKTCFNGLFRENRRGHFNVPYGHYATPHFCAANELRAASRALRGTTIEVSPFSALAEVAKPGDFVYCDPPYAPVSRTASFTNYSSGGFDEDAQRQLADLIVDLGNRGVSVLLSNSAVPFTQTLYERCHVEQVLAKRAINSRGDRRGPVPELLVAAGPIADELRHRPIKLTPTPELPVARKRQPTPLPLAGEVG